MRPSVVARQADLVRRALLTTVIAFGALATLALVPLSALVRVNQIYEQRSRLESSLEATAALTRSSVGEQRRLLLAYGTGHDPDVLEDLRRAGRTSSFALAELDADRALAVQGSVLASVGDLVSGAAALVDDELAPAVSSGDVAAANTSFDAADRLLARVESATVVLGSAVQQQARAADGALSDVLRRARTSMVFSSTLTLAVLVAASWTNVRSLAARGEARFRALVQHGSDMLVTVDGGGTIRYASPSLTATLGHAAGAVEGTPFAALVHPDDATRAAALGASLRRASSPAPPALYLRLRTAGGDWRHGEVLVSSMDDGTRVLTIRDVTDRLALESELRRRVVQDPGTGLANRAALHETLTAGLAAARRDHQPLVVIGLGLVGLREVRTLEGVVRADALVAAVAARLEGQLGPLASAARVTDDELVIVRRAAADEAEGLAATALGCLAQPVVVEGRAVGLRAAVGLTTTYGDHTPDELLRDVGLAVAQAQAEGARAWVRCDPSVHDAARAQAELAADLRQAIGHGDLRLHYQPIVSLANGDVVGVEALCRWPHPTLGAVPPDRFIPLAESSGDIDELGRWALHEACRQLRRWQDAGRDLTMAVNVAVAQVQHPGFVAEVAATLAASGVDPGRLVLEITESHLVSESVLDRARALRALGVGIAIDDFGTGYSSLSYLGRLPVTSLKVDKSFVDRLGQDDPSRGLVDTIVQLAHSFDLRTVAEGIETEEQAAVLRQLGCQLGQGYLWSPAVPPDALEAWLDDVAPGAPGPTSGQGRSRQARP